MRTDGRADGQDDAVYEVWSTTAKYMEVFATVYYLLMVPQAVAWLVGEKEDLDMKW